MHSSPIQSAVGTVVYRVEGDCNGCQLCEFLAVNNFGRIAGTNIFTVVKQPETWEELEQCKEAFERCQMHGIKQEIL
ncbi:MAG: ferredoxin [Bacteroidota bacterium]